MIKELMELGVIVEAEAAEMLGAIDKAVVIGRIKAMNPMPLLIDGATAKRLLETDVKATKRLQEMKSMSVSDLAAGYNERYNVLQRMLLRNPGLSDAVSIGSASGECSVIGMVAAGSIEDPSGTKELITDARLLDGDVIGASGTADGRVFRARQIFFPDVQPKERPRTHGKVTAGLQGEIRTDSDAWYDANGCTVVSTTARLEKIAAALGTDEKTAAAELLKRRHLTVPPKDWLEPQPDIMVFNSGENFTANHKGTVLIGIKNGSKAVIDLEDRNASFE
jgi:hypothetical protein